MYRTSICRSTHYVLSCAVELKTIETRCKTLCWYFDVLKLEEKKRQADELEAERQRLEELRIQKEKEEEERRIAEEERRLEAMVKETEVEVEESASTDLSSEPVAGDRSEEDRLTHGEKDAIKRQQLSVRTAMSCSLRETMHPTLRKSWGRGLLVGGFREGSGVGGRGWGGWRAWGGGLVVGGFGEWGWWLTGEGGGWWLDGLERGLVVGG